MTSTKILLVEDDPMVVTWVMGALSHAGYVIAAVVSSGEEAIREAAELAPDIVLMDISLSGNLDGIEAAERIRAQTDVPIVYLTGNTDEDVAYRARLSKPFGYLRKPMQAGELTLTIEISLYRHAMEAELKASNQRLQQEIAERTKSEQELQRYRDHLEELVEERTFELATANMQLQQEIAERKQAEEAVRASETRYRTLFEEATISLWEEDLSGVKDYIDDVRATGVSDMRAYFQQHPEAIMACSAKVRILDVNKATLILYRAASRAELFSQFEGIFCEDSVEGLMEGFCAIAEGRAWSRHEALNRRLTGEPLNLIVRWTVEPGYEATYARVLVSVFDITELRKHEESLRRYHRALESSISAVAFADLDARLTYVNPAFLTMWGYGDVHEVLGRPITEFWQVPEFARNIADILSAGKPWIGELSARRADGTAFDAHISANPVNDARGVPAGMTASFIDITERKRSDAQLRLLSSAVQQSSDGIVVTDLAGNILFINDAFAGMHGYTPGELSGEHLSIFHNAAQQPVVDAANAQIQTTGEFSGEIWHTRRDGTVFPGAMHISLLRDRAGRPMGMIDTLRDITERKRKEEELKIAKDTAEAANRAKNEFLANMSHELRTPLNSILGYTQILQRDSSLPEQHQMKLDHIERSGQHLLLLINDLLDLARIETGRIELTPDVFHMSAFLVHIADLIEFRAREKGIALACEFAPDLPQAVYGDETRLRQILLNLLGNAVKFTDSGGTITFTVRRVRFSEPENNVEAFATALRFEISDTGIGIPEESLEKIFEPFEHARGPQYRPESIGLGLSISQRLAQIMHTRINVRSADGRGSVFWFDLAFPDVEMVPAGQKSSSLTIVGFSGKPRKVLLVDDDAENLDVLYDMLAPLGFEVATAVNGDEGVNTAKAWLPDLILMDLKMPGIDGWEATRRIRRLPELVQVSIVAVSASAHGVTRQKALEAGCDAFFSKPFSMTLLLDTIARLLNLEWRVESGESGLRLPVSPIVSREWIFPPPDELRTLRAFIQNGLVLEINAWADRIERLDARYASFSAGIRQLNRKFAFEEMLNLLNHNLETPHD